MDASTPRTSRSSAPLENGSPSTAPAYTAPRDHRWPCRRGENPREKAIPSSFTFLIGRETGVLSSGGVRSDAARAWFLTDRQKRPLKVSRLNDKDIAVSLPAQAPDAADSVVAIEVTGEMKTDPVRLLASSGYANVLRSFDGERHGAKLRYGDGKAPTAYVFGWSDPAEWMGWKVRVNEPGLFDVSLKYTTGSAACRGKYALSAGGQTLSASVEPTPSVREMRTARIGQVRLGRGEHEVAIRPIDIQGGELMRLYHVALTPTVPTPQSRLTLSRLA